MRETKDKEENVRSTRSNRKTMDSVLRKEKRVYGRNDLRKR